MMNLSLNLIYSKKLKLKGSLLIFLILNSFCLILKSEENRSPSKLEFESVYTGLPWHNATGGIKEGSVYMDNLDLALMVNFENIFKLENKLSLFIYGLKNNGQKATDLMGDFQVASNIESVNSWRFFEFWVQNNFLKDKVSFLVGLYDLNSEFDILYPGTLFINSSFGIGAEYAAAGENGPSIFPISSFGSRVAISFGRRIKLRIALLDAVPGDPDDLRSNKIKLSTNEGVLIANELSIYTDGDFDVRSAGLERTNETRRRKVGRQFGSTKNNKINIGTWYFTNKFKIIGDSSQSALGNFGIYAGIQQYFNYNQNEDYISIFARIGFANSKFNRIGTAVSGGLVISNSLTGLDDHFGIAFTSAINGSKFFEQQNSSERIETAIEFTYSLKYNSYLMLQPDIQYIINPSTKSELENTLSFAILFQILLDAKL